MKRLTTRLEGLLLLEPDVHADARGFFLETFRADAHAAVGVDAVFVQDNQSRSVGGTLRGLHFQLGVGQAKLVRAAAGSVLDVAVDLRPRSATFGSYEAVELDDLRHRQLYVPVGFAHGFLVLSETADVVYKVSSYYDPALERGLAWNDPDIAIEWGVEAPILSERDARNPRLSEISAELPDW